MKLPTLALAALLATSAQAAGTVQVNFIAPERFADVRDSLMSSERHLDVLRRHLESAAAPYVAEGQTLKIDVLDVDLAGEPHHGARAHDVRVLRGRADWPRIQLRYTLDAPGEVARSGEATIRDLAYLQHVAVGYSSDEPLRYERRMLDEWFRFQFGH